MWKQHFLLNVSSPEVVNPHLQWVLCYFPGGFTQSSTLSFSSGGSANALCKEPHSKHLRLDGSCCCCCTFSTLPQSTQKQWPQLCSSDTLWAVKCGLPIIFAFNEMVFFFQPFKNVNLILSLQAIQKPVADQMWPVVHGFPAAVLGIRGKQLECELEPPCTAPSQFHMGWALGVEWHVHYHDWEGLGPVKVPIEMSP